MVVETVIQGAQILPVTLTGTVTAARQAELSSRVSGLVVGNVPDVGHSARRGAVLMSLDPTLAEIRLNESLAEIEVARAELAEAERLRDEAVALESNIARTTQRSRTAEVTVRQATLARLEAAYWYQSELIDRHKILAPFDGVVVRKRTETGEWVETGTPVLDFVGTERPRVDVQVPQQYFPKIPEGSVVSVAIDAVSPQPITGTVQAKAPLGDMNARTVLVRIAFEQTETGVVPGMSAEVRFDLPDLSAGLTVSRDAIVRYPDGTTTVWVLDGPGNQTTAHEQAVKLGRASGDRVQVDGGLAAGARVVVRGNEILDDGGAVQVVERVSAVTP